MLSEKEFIILSKVRENARISLAEISRQTKIPVTTIYDTLNRLKKRKIIEKQVSIIDFSKIGFGTRINLILKADKKNELIEYLKSNPNVNSIHKVSGNYDFLIDVVFSNLINYESFKDELKKFDLTNIREHHIVEEVKKEGANLNF